MLVFLSWSGDRSKKVAQALELWLRQVIQAADPWMSSDIEKGTRWSPEIATRLEQSRVGIICLTSENLDAPWILFEAGAISKARDAYVCTVLLDIAPGDVPQPFSQFQHTGINRDEIRRLLFTVNSAVSQVGERALSEAVLNAIFDVYWPRLAESLTSIAAQAVTRTPQVQSEREMLQDVLQSVNNLEKRLAYFEKMLIPLSLPAMGTEALDFLIDRGLIVPKADRELVRQALHRLFDVGEIKEPARLSEVADVTTPQIYGSVETPSETTSEPLLPKIQKSRNSPRKRAMKKKGAAGS